MPVARADGDPASDYLITRQTFLPFTAKIPEAQVEGLNGIVKDANEKGYKVRVAIISKPFDLGAVPSLFRKPKTYARFLGQELAFVYKNRLLIVMPNGYGVARGGKAAAGRAASRRRAAAARRRRPCARGRRDASGAPARRELRREAVAPKSSDSTTDDRLIIAGAAAGLLLLIGAGFVMRRLLAHRH